MGNFEIISERDFMKARKKIRELKKLGKSVVFSGESDDINRNVIEKEDVDVLLLNLSGKKDRQKQRESGFNHVLARIAKKRNVKIGINLDEIILSGKSEKARILSRVIQNVKLCSKNKVGMEFFSINKACERNIYDLKALGSVLGMPTWMTKNLGK